jgi:hypothetical protein
MELCFPKGKKMHRVNAEKTAMLEAEIKRQATTGVMRRYAASLPLYSVPQELPDYFANMLKKLEAAEKRVKR